MKDSNLKKIVQNILSRPSPSYFIDEGLTANVLSLYLDGKNYAIKLFKDVQSLEERQQELAASISIKSQYVVTYVCHEESGLDWLLYERFGHYNLYKYLQLTQLNQYEVYHIFTQILKGCRDILNCGYYHCDMKTANILIDQETLNIKICDLGFASDVKLQQHRRKGSSGYMAPEYLENLQPTPSEKTEVYALGVILHQLLTGQFPYKNQLNCVKWLQLLKKEWKDFWKGSKISSQYREILQKMLNVDPDQRCSLNYLETIFHL